MNGIQLNGKPRRLDKPGLGCLGKMVNLFDLASIKSNRLLTDKPHYDGSSLSRSRSDVSSMSSMAGNEMQAAVNISGVRLSPANRKPHGTPVKMLLAQEMSKDLESRQQSPNVVARLMGLDPIPQNPPDLAAQRSHSRSYSQNSHLENYWQEDHGFFPQQSDFEGHPYREESDYKDIYRIWHQPPRMNCIRDESSKKRLYNENGAEKKLALIRQKFMEAKRLATDENLRQTKEFQDALNVLSSNGDLFLKVLQEPNSIFSHILSGGQFIPPPPETKRITVLKPSKMLNEKQAKKQVQVNLWDNHDGFSPTMSMWKADDSPAQPTRIVVLKPSAAKFNDPKVAISSTPSSPRILQSDCFSGEPEEEEEAREAREVAKEITQRMRENLAGHRRDETLLSSVFSNGYTGDESSCDKSENEFATGNLSDSEVMSPVSRNSWDCVNRYGSPYSSTSFSRASYSPESSVCREAKRRLSERWAMISSSQFNQEQRQIYKSSSTLGEMLALSDIMKPEICEEDKNTDQNLHGSTSCLNSNTGAGGSGDASPRSLLRSKSVPISSTRLNVEVSNQALCKENASSDTMKTKDSKSSFAGKVTSLFFSRNKKPKKEKFKKQSNDESQLATADTPLSVAPPRRTSSDQSELFLKDRNDQKHGQSICSQQGRLCVPQRAMAGIHGNSQEQPSPISVLEPPFEEEPGKQMPLFLSKSNLIDKSPPIGSIARTLSFDECSAELATTYPLNSASISCRAEDEEDEWRSLVQSVLTMAGLDDDGSIFAKWHSPESPLDPLLRDKYIDLTAKEPLHEAKRRQLRSTQKLVFDCVNATVLDLTDVITTASRWGRAQNGLLGNGLAETVWDRAKEWVLGNVKCPPEDGGDSASLVEWEVWKEVMGKGWANQIRVEVEIIGKEIEGKLLQELVEEYVVERTVTD